MLGKDEKMQPLLDDFPKFAQAISEARKLSKTHKVEFRRDCDKGVIYFDKGRGGTCPLVHKF